MATSATKRKPAARAARAKPATAKMAHPAARRKAVKR